MLSVRPYWKKEAIYGAAKATPFQNEGWCKLSLGYSNYEMPQVVLLSINRAPPELSRFAMAEKILLRLVVD